MKYHPALLIPYLNNPKDTFNAPKTKQSFNPYNTFSN